MSDINLSLRDEAERQQDDEQRELSRESFGLIEIQAQDRMEEYGD